MRDDLSDFADIDRLEQGAKSLAQGVYIVQAVAWFVPILWLLAAGILFFKRDQYEDAWASSHLRWQWRTIWFGALWGGLSFLLVFFPPVMWLAWAVLALWLAYRVVRGWLRLSADQSFYGY